MVHGLFITGTDYRVGKTLVACALAFAAHARGIRVGVMKPIDTACDEIDGVLESRDARGLAYAAAVDLQLDLICPYRYRAALDPIAAAEADRTAPPDLVEIEYAYRKIAARSDLVIVESIGGLMTPIALDPTRSNPKDNADLARALNLEVAVVAGNRLGCLSATMLTIHYARSRGVGIIGTILNDIDDAPASAAETNLQSLRTMADVPNLGRVRFKQPVTREIIDALLPSR